MFFGKPANSPVLEAAGMPDPAPRSTEEILLLVSYYHAQAAEAQGRGFLLDFIRLTQISGALLWAAGLPEPQIDEQMRHMQQTFASLSRRN
jgi:DNA-binding GntR family transcriptional regulator